MCSTFLRPGFAPTAPGVVASETDYRHSAHHSLRDRAYVDTNLRRTQNPRTFLNPKPEALSLREFFPLVRLIQVGLPTSPPNLLAGSCGNPANYLFLSFIQLAVEAVGVGWCHEKVIRRRQQGSERDNKAQKL